MKRKLGVALMSIGLIVAFLEIGLDLSGRDMGALTFIAVAGAAVGLALYVAGTRRGSED